MKPKSSPLGTAKVTPSRASWRPYRLRKPSMAIIRGPRKIADFVGWSWPHQLESRVDGACVLLLGAHPDNPSCQLARLEVDVQRALGLARDAGGQGPPAVGGPVIDLDGLDRRLEDGRCAGDG